MVRMARSIPWVIAADEFGLMTRRRIFRLINRVVILKYAVQVRNYFFLLHERPEKKVDKWKGGFYGMVTRHAYFPLTLGKLADMQQIHRSTNNCLIGLR